MGKFQNEHGIPRLRHTQSAFKSHKRLITHINYTFTWICNVWSKRHRERDSAVLLLLFLEHNFAPNAIQFSIQVFPFLSLSICLLHSQFAHTILAEKNVNKKVNRCNDVELLWCFNEKSCKQFLLLITFLWFSQTEPQQKISKYQSKSSHEMKIKHQNITIATK